MGLLPALFHFDPDLAFDVAFDDFRNALSTIDFDVVLIGAGVRNPPPFLLTFERLINLIHSNAPRAKIAFNTNPDDSTEAILRWL